MSYLGKTMAKRGAMGRWLAVLVLGVSMYGYELTAFGQSPDKVRMAAVDSLVKKFLRYQQTLNDLRPALRGADHETVLEIEEIAITVQFSLDHISDLLHLRWLMVADEDREAVSEVLQLQAKTFTQLCELNIKQLNVSMGFSHNAALVSEAQEIKKALDTACSTVGLLR